MAKTAEETAAALERMRAGRNKDLSGSKELMSQESGGLSRGGEKFIDRPKTTGAGSALSERKATARPPSIQQVPPHSQEAEMGVLSSILQNPRTCIPIAQQRISQDHFYVPALRLMFNAALNFYE